MPNYEHHHHHGENFGCEERCGIEIDIHEGALIGTYSGYMIAENIENARDILSSQMTRIASFVTEAGGIIGHIKSIVSEEGRGYQISVTEENAAIRTLEPSAYHADIAVIIFALEEETLHRFMEMTVGTVIVSNNEG